MKVINLISIIFNLIQKEKMRCRSKNDRNKEGPITCKIRIKQPKNMYMII